MHPHRSIPEKKARPSNFLLRVAIFVLLAGLVAFSCKEPAKEKNEAGTAEPAASDSHPGKPLRKVRLLPYWVTTAQFGGYYIGIEKGIFRKHGIDLEILPFNPFIPTRDEIESGRADFAVLWLVNAIELKSDGVDIVNIAQLSSRSSLMLLAKKSSRIRKLSDLNGRTAGIWSGYELQPRALFSKYDLNVKMIPIGSTNTLFLLDAVDVINANWFDEYHSILNNGYDTTDLVRFFFADYGLNFLEDGIYCLSEKARSDPQLCVDFVEASLESWNYAFSHPDETLDIVIRLTRKENRPVNRSHQRWMLTTYHELYIPKGQQAINTVLRKEDYENIRAIMLESKLIRNEVPYGQFYRHYETLAGSGKSGNQGKQ